MFSNIGLLLWYPGYANDIYQWLGNISSRKSKRNVSSVLHDHKNDTVECYPSL